MAAEYWYVIYKALGDFGDLIKDAAKARAELAALQKAVKDEGAADVAASKASTLARQKEIDMISEERKAYQVLRDAAKDAAVWTDFGGRGSMPQHLSDKAQELQWETLLNRQRWLGFSSPQAAYSWRQLELYQAWLMNRAHFGATSSGTGYTTPDQYLSYLQKEYAALSDESTVLKARAGIYNDMANAYLAYARAISGRSGLTIGLLGEALPGVQQIGAALAGLPAQVTTTVNVDDSAAIAKLASYAAVLRGLPASETTVLTESEVLKAAYGLGGVPLPSALPHEQIPVTFEPEGFQKVLGEVAELKAAKADIPVTFHVDENYLSRLKSLIPGGESVTISEHVTPGGAVGVGAGPPQIQQEASAVQSLADHLLALAASESDAGRAAYIAQTALNLMAKAAKDAAAGEKEAEDNASGTATALGVLARGFIGATQGWAAMGTKIALFGGLFTVGLWHILADAIIEFAIALGGAIIGVAALAAAVGIFLGVASQAQDTLGRISDRLKATYTAATATGQAIYPVTQGFDKLAHVIRPEVWQLYGDALNLINGRMGLLGSIAVKTGAFIDQLAAKFIAWFNQPSVQHGLTDLIKSGVAFAEQFGRIFLNLGQVIYSFFKAAQLTHIAEDIGAIIIALTRLASVVLKFVPTPLLAIVFALHAIYLWGGLAVTAVIALLDPLRALALALGAVDAASVEGGLAGLGKDASAGSRLKGVFADISAGLGSLGARFGLVGGAAKAAGADMALVGDEAALMSGETAAAATGTAAFSVAVRGLSASLLGLLANPVTAILAVVAALTFVTIEVLRAKDATLLWIQSINDQLAKQSLYTVIGKTVSDLAAVTQKLGQVQHGAAGNAGELASAQSDLSGKLQLELTHVGDVSKAYGVGMVGALNLLQTAGVKTSSLFSSQSQVWAAAMVQVAGLVQGYKAMGQGLTQLQGDVSVQLVMNADQLTQMGNLNTAWDSWLKLVESGPVAYNALAQGINTLNTDLQVSGASFDGANAASLTLQAAFQSLVPQMGSVQDAIRNYSAVLMDGAAGSQMLVQATKDMIASSGLLNTSNQQVRNGLLAVAQEADPSINTWQKLTQWIGPLGASKAAADLNSILTKLQTPLTNLQQDAAKLTTALQQDLNPAMAQAEFNALGGQKAFDTFASDLQKFGPNSKVTIDAGKAVAEMLLSIDKNSGTAKDQFVAWGESMGLTAGQATQLWDEVSKGQKPLSAVRDALARAATSGGDLAKSGFWAQVRDKITGLADQVKSHPIAFAIAGAANFIPGVTAALDTAGHAITGFFTKDVPAAWNSAYTHFQRDFAGPLTDWFTKSLPHGLKDAWDKVWSALVDPVTHAFDDVKKAITSGFDKWWSQHGDEVETVWTAVTGKLTSAWDTFTGGIMAAWNAVIGFFSGKGDIAHFIKKAFDDTLITLAPFLGILKGGFTLAWDAVATAFKVAWSLIEGIAKSVWDVIANAVVALAKTAADAVVASFKLAWDFVQAAAKVVWDAIVGIINVVLDLITGHWGKAWTDMKTAALQIWNAISGFVTGSWNTLMTFFRQVWGTAWGFLKTTAVQVWNALTTAGNNAITSLWHFFYNDFISPLENFFLRTIPGWFDSLVTHAQGAWHSVWTWFSSDVAGPIGRVFSGIPGTIESVFHTGVSTVVHYINDVLGFFHLPLVKFAAGGMVGAASGGGISSYMAMAGSVPGAGDSDSQIAAVMPGEWVLRKPARMALQAVFGPDFLPSLNYADRWLGAGSRGTAASQGPSGGLPAYQLGGLVGDFEKGLSSLGKNLLSFIENPVAEVEHIFTNLAGAALGNLNFGLVGEILNAVAHEAEGSLTSAASSASKAVLTGAVVGGLGAAVGGNVGQWITAALALTGTPVSWLAGMETLVSKESGGNPRAVNPVTAGTSGEHAEGIAQTIPTTFQAYALPGLWDIFNPVDDLVASIRYIKANYGTVYNIPGILGGAYGGYASGGQVIAAWDSALKLLKQEFSGEGTAYTDLYRAAVAGHPSAGKWRESQVLKTAQNNLGLSWMRLMAGEPGAMTPAKWQAFDTTARNYYLLTGLGRPGAFFPGAPNQPAPGRVFPGAPNLPAGTPGSLPLLDKADPGRVRSLGYWLSRLTGSEPQAYSAWQQYEKTIAGDISRFRAYWHDLGVSEGQLRTDWNDFALVGRLFLTPAEGAAYNELGGQWTSQKGLFSAFAGAAARDFAAMNAGEWGQLESRDATWDSIMTNFTGYASGPASGGFFPGAPMQGPGRRPPPRPSSSTARQVSAALRALRAKRPAQYGFVERDLRQQDLLLKQAYPLWKELYGPGGLIGTPGPSPGPVPPITPGTGGGPITVTPGPAVNVMPAATLGGPANPVFDVAPGGANYGFSGGGTIHPYGMAAGGAVLSPAEALSLFSSGLNAGSVMMPGSAAMGLNTAAGTVASGSRVLSDAAASARRVGVESLSIVVNNPSPAAAESSVAHAANRAMFLAGRQVA